MDSGNGVFVDSTVNNSKPWYMSSVDPTSLSLTVKGLLASVIPLLLIAFKFYHINIGEDVLNGYVGQVESIVYFLTSALAVGMTLWGAIRKLWH